MPTPSQRKYRLPHKVSDARVLVGARIEVYWQHSTDPNANEAWPEGWYAGHIDKVTRSKVEGKDKTLFLVR